MSEIRVMPLPDVCGKWLHDSSKYPDVIKIPMRDGKVIRYRIDIDQPHPQLLEAIENIRNMKRAGDAATSTGPVVDEKHPNSLYHQTKRDATRQNDNERW